MSLITEAVEVAEPSWLKVAFKLAPYVAIALLVVAFLWQRIDLTKTKSERDTYKSQAEEASKTIKDFSLRQVDNDAIAVAVAAKLATNTKQVETIRTKLKEAQHEPAVRTWADMPVPDSVRRALETVDPAPAP